MYLASQRAAQERRARSRRMFEQSVQQLNRNIQILQQTRERQQRAQRLQQARERQRELQRQAEHQRQQTAYDRQRQARERQRAEARRQQAALLQRQTEARRQQEQARKRQEEERKRQQEQARKRQAASAATAAHCLQSRRLKGGFNVADLEIRNTCGYSINVSGACSGTSFKANYPYKGTYSPYESLGLDTLSPGKWRPAVLHDMCNKKGRTARSIACRAPFVPHFTSPSGGSYACFK